MQAFILRQGFQVQENRTFANTTQGLDCALAFLHNTIFRDTCSRTCSGIVRNYAVSTSTEISAVGFIKLRNVEKTILKILSSVFPESYSRSSRPSSRDSKS